MLLDDTTNLPDLDLPTEDMQFDAPLALWWNESFEQRVSVNLNAGGADEVVRIVVPASVIPFNQIRPNGEDLRFVQGGQTLAFQLESVSEERISAWVRVPDVDDRLYLYWGNPDAGSGQAPETFAGYEAVFNLNDDSDSGPQAIAAVAEEGTVEFNQNELGSFARLTGGKIGYDVASPTLVVTQPDAPVMWIGIWAKLDEASDSIFANNENWCSGWRVGAIAQQMFMVMDSTLQDCTDHAYNNAFVGTVEAQRWSHFAYVYDLNTLTVTFYVDGTYQGIKELVVEGVTGRGGRFNIGGEEGINAEIDLIHVRRTVPTPADIGLQYRSFSGTLASFGEPERLD